MIVATAPGKAVLSGEYAVLHGAPAAAAAVDCRARVNLTATDGNRHCLATAGFSAGEYAFRETSTGDVEWLQPLPAGANFGLFETLWKCFFRAGRPPLSVSIDTRAFFDAEGTKLGFGSSAAVTVALAAALQRLDADARPLEEIALAAHRRFQGGRGSGIDIATSIRGGLVDFRLAGAAVMPWPGDLHYRLLWSGQPADTVDRIARLDKAPASRRQSSLDNLCAAAEAAMTAWRSGKAEAVIAGLRHYVAGLRRFSTDLDLGIFDAGHEQLANLAASDGIVYKPCGAGGGDIGMVLACESQAIEAFCRRAAPLGFRRLEVALDMHGVSTESEASGE